MRDYHIIIGTSRQCGKTKRATEIASDEGKYVVVSPTSTNEEIRNLIKKHNAKAVIIELSKFNQHTWFTLDLPGVMQIYTIHAPEFKGFVLETPKKASIEFEIL